VRSTLLRSLICRSIRYSIDAAHCFMRRARKAGSSVSSLAAAALCCQDLSRFTSTWTKYLSQKERLSSLRPPRPPYRE
jgi:hypothetical protein